jgi:hypothetical protein
MLHELELSWIALQPEHLRETQTLIVGKKRVTKEK